jgi:HlyD family secretion protein
MRKALIGAAAVAVLALVVWASLRDAGGRGSPVELAAAERRTISSTVKATGEITPERKVAISAKVIGEIIKLPVKEGDVVRQGQLLVEIERDLYEAARDQAKAALEQTQVSLERLQVQLADAQRTLRRTSSLEENGLSSQQDLDAAQLAADSAEVEVRAQRHAVEQYRSALRRAEDDLARTSIRSPMDGIVIQLDAERGETVVPGNTNLPGSVIMTIADMSRLLAEVEVSEVDVVQVALGQPTEVLIDALGDDKPQRGHVVEIATSGRKDAALGTIRFQVKVAIDDPDPQLRPAMTAKVNIVTATHDDALAVPIQAVVKRTLDDTGKEVRGTKAKGLEEREVVYTLVDGKAKATPVETGIADEVWVEILDGLSDGDKVVAGPYRNLKELHDGDAIHEQEPDEHAADSTTEQDG